MIPIYTPSLHTHYEFVNNFSFFLKENTDWSKESNFKLNSKYQSIYYYSIIFFKLRYFCIKNWGLKEKFNFSIIKIKSARWLMVVDGFRIKIAINLLCGKNLLFKGTAKSKTPRIFPKYSVLDSRMRPEINPSIIKIKNSEILNNWSRCTLWVWLDSELKILPDSEKSR